MPIDDSLLTDDATPNKKNHIGILVSMVNEKNKYIKDLHKKIDKLNEVIHN